ncbi:MAG: response regulator [Pleurocapsa sp. SU_196_0]|nr:response regulator [Pleurocapsa sp. SU_196_0]
MNILIVEDEQHSRSELEYLLEQLEPNVSLQTAEDALSAWALLERTDRDAPLDVVFLDIQIPGMSGLELAARSHDSSVRLASCSPLPTQNTPSPRSNSRAWIMCSNPTEQRGYGKRWNVCASCCSNPKANLRCPHPPRRSGLRVAKSVCCSPLETFCTAKQTAIPSQRVPSHAKRCRFA